MINENHWDSFFRSSQNVSEECFSDEHLEASLGYEIMIKVSVDINNPLTFPKGFADKVKLDATTEEQIMQQEKQDDEQLRLDATIKNA